MVRFGVCKCFFRQNIFVEEWKAHVKFESREQFLNDYASRRPSDEILAAVESEVKRRRGLQEERKRFRTSFENTYKAIHGDVYSLKPEYFDPAFGDLSKVSRLGQDVFSFPVFTDDFCRRLLDELRSIAGCGLPLTRPNSMNKSGILLDDVGFTPFFDSFRVGRLQEICDALFPDLGRLRLDSHRAFVVHYKAGDDKFDQDLHYHFDNAEITLNVSLSEGHDGGELVFDGLKHDPPGSAKLLAYEHKFAYGVLHRGDHVHSAMPIEDGERWNLILWMRSSERRNTTCPMCNESPDLEEVPGGSYGDGFTMQS